MTQPLTEAARAKRFRRRAVWGVLCFALTLGALIRTLTVLTFPHITFPLGPPNPDVWIRLTEVRQWLTGGGFFNHAVTHTNAPIGGVETPWTRPIDIILSGLYFLFTPHGMTPTVRLMLAACWMAPVFCLIAVILMAEAARRHFDHTHVRVAVVLLTIFNTYLGDYFSPGDADHHGFMSMLWCGVLCLITRDTLSAGAAFAAGALLGGITWVSPEGLLLAGPVYAFLGFEALLQPKKMISLAILTLGTACVVTGALFVEHPLGELARPHYDSLSIVHVLLLWLIAAAAVMLALVYECGVSLAARCVAVTAAGVSIAAAMYAVFPKFYGGPMVDVDPFIFTHFLPNVSEAQPLYKTPWPDIIRQLTEPALVLALLAACFRHGWKDMRANKRRYLLLLAVLFFYTLVLTLVQVRWEYYLQPVCIILCAALLPGVSFPTRIQFKNVRVPRQWRPYSWIVVIFALMNLAAKVAPVHARTVNLLCMNEIRFVLQTQQLQPLLGDKDMVVYMPENTGGDALYFTPYSIIASNYHREGQGMKDMFAIAAATSDADTYAALSKRKTRALLYCPGDYAATSYLRQVGQGTRAHPRWMTPVTGLKFFDYEGQTFEKPVLYKFTPRS